jgi:hypothetical protein
MVGHLTSSVHFGTDTRAWDDDDGDGEREPTGYRQEEAMSARERERERESKEDESAAYYLPAHKHACTICDYHFGGSY